MAVKHAIAVVLFGLAVRSAAPQLAAAEAEGVAAEDVVKLPPFIVEDTALEPPWRYARTGRFEILSCCPLRETRALAQTVLRAYELVHLFVPQRLLSGPEVPDALIFFDDYYWPVASREAIATRMRSAMPFAPLPADTQRRIVEQDPLFAGGSLPREAPPRGRRADFFHNLRLGDGDAMTTFILVSRSNLDLDGWRLSPGAVRELLERRVPTLPSWVVAGFLGLYREMEFRDDVMTLPPAVWVSDEETRKLLRDPASARAMLPLEEFFAEPAIGAADKALIRLAQAEILVRWALEPGQATRRESFWRFVERACAEPESEAMFEECFGASFAGFTTTLTAYLPTAVRKSTTWRASAADDLPSLELREATHHEVARIKGNWERLEARYVRRNLPVLESRYYELARRTLTRDDEAHGRDPGVLGVLGMLERDAGNFTEAQQVLTDAAQLGVIRPRAILELAALRYTELRGASPGPGRAMARRDAGELLELLTRARRQTPPMLETYELVATVWANCVDAPHPNDFAVLDEGVALFWRNAGFVLQVASLHAARGSADRAAALVEIGLRHAVDEDVRRQLLALREELVARRARLLQPRS